MSFYNEKTARLYTDLSLMTADPKIGTESAQVFQALAMGEAVEDMDHLLVAPKCLQNKVLAMIDTEIEHAKAGEPSYIGLKMNSQEVFLQQAYANTAAEGKEQ